METQERKRFIKTARTFLFVPADQPERIAKALNTTSDAVIVDLEDAVRSENKAQTRIQLELPPRSAATPLIFIRVNAFGSPEFEEDIRKAIELSVDGIILPKFVPGVNAVAADEAISRLEAVGGSDEPLAAIGLIESSAGVLGLLNSASIPTRVERLAFGGADLYTDLGISFSASGPNTDLAMAAIVMASVHSQLGSPVDTPHFTLGDDPGLKERSEYAARMGFGGKLCIHPNQLEIVSQSFVASKDENEWAEKVMARWNARNESAGALVVNNNLVDAAMVKRAKAILGLL